MKKPQFDPDDLHLTDEQAAAVRQTLANLDSTKLIPTAEVFARFAGQKNDPTVRGKTRRVRTCLKSPHQNPYKCQLHHADARSNESLTILP